LLVVHVAGDVSCPWRQDGFPFHLRTVFGGFNAGGAGRWYGQIFITEFRFPTRTGDGTVCFFRKEGIFLCAVFLTHLFCTSLVPAWLSLSRPPNYEPVDGDKSHPSPPIPGTCSPPRLNNRTHDRRLLPRFQHRELGPQDLCTPRGLATSPTASSHLTHIRASSSMLTLGKSHICPPTHSSHPIPQRPPHLRPRPTAHPSHSPSSRPKKTGRPLPISCLPSPGLFNFPLPRQADLGIPRPGVSILEQQPLGSVPPSCPQTRATHPRIRLILPFHRQLSSHLQPLPAAASQPSRSGARPRPRHREISIVPQPYYPQSHNPATQAQSLTPLYPSSSAVRSPILDWWRRFP
jgi:hypothetical protein